MNYESMTTPELEARLAELLEKLDDTEDLRVTTLGQEGQHIPGAALAKRFAKEIDGLNEEIALIKAAMEKR